ncbi:hypothetical protein ACHAW6_013519 [Cyclotella cf. meneghiniana]
MQRVKDLSVWPILSFVPRDTCQGREGQGHYRCERSGDQFGEVFGEGAEEGSGKSADYELCIGWGEEVLGYVIEEVEETKEDGSRVVTVVFWGKSLKVERVVVGIELGLEGLDADAAERAEKKAAEIFKRCW